MEIRAENRLPDCRKTSDRVVNSSEISPFISVACFLVRLHDRSRKSVLICRMLLQVVVMPGYESRIARSQPQIFVGLQNLLLQICAALQNAATDLVMIRQPQPFSFAVGRRRRTKRRESATFCTRGLGKAAAENSRLISLLLTTRSEVFRQPGRRSKACSCSSALRSSRMRALVNVPRSPTRIICSSPKRVRSHHTF